MTWPRSPAFLLLLAIAGCDACRGTRVAELAATVGTVHRDFAGRPGGWRGAQVGDAFEVGDGVRTAARSSAELRLSPSGRLRVEADTVVRFSATAPERGAFGVQLEAGEIELEAISADYVVGSADERAQLKSGGRVRVRADERALRFSVAVGRVLLEHDGRTRELRAGESFELEVGPASIEPANEAPALAAAEPQPPESASAPNEPAGFDLPPAAADFELAAGESATIHDPAPPSNVRVRFAGCPGDLALEVVRAGGAPVTRVRGGGGATAALPVGQLRYRVRCAEADGAFAARPAAEGRLHVVRDAATRKLPTGAPSITVDADGRKYTVRFQNLPPQLTFRWREAPKAAFYDLTLRAEGRAPVRERGSAPLVTLRSGRVEEGTYAFRFEAGAVHSPDGTLKVAFDNTARIAYLAAPEERGFRVGPSVRIAGAALRGARVAVDGVEVPLLAHGRFDTHVAIPAERTALAVRVQHPATGIHYFLRHAAGDGD